LEPAGFIIRECNHVCSKWERPYLSKILNELKDIERKLAVKYMNP
jgi:hypothetical protein